MFSDVKSVTTVRGYVNSILSNLLTNAIKYHKQGVNPVINVYTKKVKSYTELYVEDNGMGIDLKKFGDRLFKFKQRFHLGIEGHGIGLYLVKTQAEAIGGSVLVNSEVNKGSTFLVRIPR
ncbi:MAG: sensor histidine kinase [Bacteroidia bacterium]